jgi:maltose/moltooligosaccharide transporter
MKLNYKRTFFVGLAFMSILAFWELYDGVVPKMLSKTFGMGETLIGFVMALDNILALFLLPLIGAFSDKVNTRIGKRMPFILAGTALASIFILIMPAAEHKGSLALFIAALGGVLISMGLYRSPAVALMPDITPKPLRSKANAIINLMGTLGGAYALVMIMFLYKEDGSSNLPLFMSVAALMIAAVILLVLTINERKLSMNIENEAPGAETKAESTKMPREVRRSFIFIMSSIFLWFFAYNAVKSAFSRYADVVWGLTEGKFTNPLIIAIIAALISYIPIGIISSKIGRKKTIIIGIILMTLSYFFGFLVTEYTPVVNVIFTFTGIGWAAINVNSYPMVVEMCKGADTGRYTGYYYTFSMASQIVTPIVSGFLLENVSYRTLFPYAVIFSIASLCTMLFVMHGDSKPVKKADVLENYDNDN